MILTVDVGNTQTQLGLFKCDNNQPEHTWLIKTEKDKTVDDLFVSLVQLKEAENLDFCGVTLVSIACVVPNLIAVWKDCVKKVSKIQDRKIDCKFLNAQTVKSLSKEFFDCKYAFPNEIGADVIAAAIATKTLFGYPSVSIDFGTATNFNVLNKDGGFLGGLITPGINPSLEALISDTSLLPNVEIKAPENVIGKDTIESIQSGIVLGEASKADGVIEKIADQLSCDMKVITTGGWSKILTSCMKTKAEFAPNLILQGLKIFADNIDCK